MSKFAREFTENHRSRQMNNQRYSVRASNIEVFAPIGLHPEERIIDNHFVVNVEIISDRPYAREHFINYELIVTAVKKEFEHPHEILEDVALGIMSSIAAELQGRISSIRCDINKMRPGLSNINIGALGVSLTVDY